MAARATRRLAARMRKDPQLRLRQATVEAVNSDGTVDVTLSGTSIPSVRVVGQVVPSMSAWLTLQDGDLLVIGTPGLAAPGDHWVGADPLTDWPLGATVMQTTSSGSGWPETNGVVETIRATGSYGHQTHRCMSHDPPDVRCRRWIVGTAAWSTWATL